MKVYNLLTDSLDNQNKLFLDGIDYINTDDATNEKLNYYYFIPKSTIESKKPSSLLICIPGLSASGERFVNAEFKQLALTDNFIIISPTFIFNNEDWHKRKSYQYPEKWSGKALLNIIKKINKQGYNTKDNYLYGFSAGAQFAIRFALWKPDLCKAVIAHARGGELIRANIHINTKFFLSVGKQDTSRIENTEVFYYSAEWLNIKAIYKVYDCAHTIPLEQITDSIEFIQNVKNDTISFFDK